MPDYKGKEYYAPEQNDKIDTLDKRFLGLTNVQIGLFTLPALITLTTLILILMNRKARKNPAVYVSLAIGLIHLYHHYTLTRLQNKYVQ
jgi:hypothetical protein